MVRFKTTRLEREEVKCRKCRHYYEKMVGANGKGYNPYPCYQLYDDAGRHPNVLTQDCYEPRQSRKKVKQNGNE